MMIDLAREVETKSVPQAVEVTELAHQCTAIARERIAEGSNRVKEYVAREPARALGIAFGVGVLIGWLIKRR
jgi:ElaB/YqjD/DUF883 family membrane-anchored ribosome-binding protein